MDKDRYYQSKSARALAALDDMQSAGQEVADAGQTLLIALSAPNQDQEAVSKAKADLKAAVLDYQKMSSYYSDYWT